MPLKSYQLHIVLQSIWKNNPTGYVTVQICVDSAKAQRHDACRPRKIVR